MFSKLVGFITPYKLYIYIALGAMLLAGWALDRHHQFKKGEEACQLKQAEAKADYWQNRSERLIAESKVAIKKEQTVSDTLNTRKNKRAAAVQKSIDLDTGGRLFS